MQAHTHIYACAHRHQCGARDYGGFEHTCAYTFTTLKTGENSSKFEKQAPVCHGAASLCGVGLILSDDIQSDCPRLTAFTITEERHAVVNKNVFTISKDLLYPRLY